jgi:hypothetical protein
LAAVERELGRRHAIHRHEGLRMVVVDPPTFVTDELGPRPTDDLRGQRAWDRGARMIASYRQRHGATIDPPHADWAPARTIPPPGERTPPPADASRPHASSSAAPRRSTSASRADQSCRTPPAAPSGAGVPMI